MISSLLRLVTYLCSCPRPLTDSFARLFLSASARSVAGRAGSLARSSSQALVSLSSKLSYTTFADVLSTLDITVQLPGTHGIIFSWDPPSFGIPAEVLKELVKDLEAEVVRWAVEQANLLKSGSTQYSPRFIGSDVEPDYPPLDMTLSYIPDI